MVGDDCEQLVVDLYRAHRFDPCEPVSPWEIVRRELAQRGGTLRTPPRAPGGSHVYTLRGLPHIVMSARMHPHAAAHGVGHELGHVLLDALGVDRSIQEPLADRIGGALLAPRDAVERFAAIHGRSVARLARVAKASQTWAALRFGEALDVPVAALSPFVVRHRGAEIQWPDERTLRMTAWSSAIGRRVPLLPRGRSAFLVT